MKKNNNTNNIATRRKPPLRRRRKKSNVINLEEYCLKKINESYLSREFFYENLNDSIESRGGYGTKESLASILEYMDFYHKGAKIGQPYLILEQRGLL